LVVSDANTNWQYRQSKADIKLNLKEIEMNNFITAPTAKNVNVEFKNSSKADEAAFAATKQEAAQEIRLLVTEREVWENGVFRTANEALYVLLSKCYEIDFSMSGKDAASKARRKGLEEVALQLGYRFQDGTALMNKVVRCVFGDVHRNRVSAYAAALREAKHQKIEVANIAQFIEMNGGIGGITRPRTETTITEAEKAEQALEIISDDVLAIADGKELGQSFEGEDLDRPCVLIATPQDDGSFAINAVVKSKAALTAALVSVYSTHHAEMKKVAAEKKEAETRQTVKTARQTIVREATGAHYAI